MDAVSSVVQCPICKKKHCGGRRQARGSRRRSPQPLLCNTNTGVRIDPPPGAQIDGDSGGQKIIGRVEPPPPTPRQIGPWCCNKPQESCMQYFKIVKYIIEYLNVFVNIYLATLCVVNSNPDFSVTDKNSVIYP